MAPEYMTSRPAAEYKEVMWNNKAAKINVIGSATSQAATAKKVRHMAMTKM